MEPSDLPVVVLAGGLATRLRPITESIPKLLVEVAGAPFFTHQIRLLKESGLRKIVLCVGYLGEMIREQYGDGSAHGVEIEYSFDGEKLLGTGGALIKALPLLGPAFYVLYGDSYLPVDYSEIGRKFLDSEKLGLMTVFQNEDHFDTSNVWWENGQIRVYEKKNKRPEMRHIDYGLGMFRQGAFDPFPREAPLDLSTVQTSLVGLHQLMGYEVYERFFEVGSHDGLAELNQMLRLKKISPEGGLN